MAYSAGLKIYCWTNGSDSNGGGFVAGSGTDYSQQAAAQYTFTDLTSSNATSGSPTVSSLSHSFVTADVGNLMYISAGTNWTVGRYQIVSVAGGNATLDRACGSSASVSGGTYAVGGALLSPSIACGLSLVAGNIVYVKAGTYTITSASTNTAAGCVNLSNGAILEGYNSTPGDLGTPPLLQASGISTFTLVTVANNSDCIVRNISVDGANLTSSRGFAIGRALGYKLTAINCTNSGIANNTGVPLLLFCKVSGCSSQPAILNGRCYWCEAYSNTITGISTSSDCYYSLAYNNSGASSDGIVLTAAGTTALGCTAYNNGRYGMSATPATGCYMQNCISESNATRGFSLVGGYIIDCYAYNNTTNFSLTGNPVIQQGSITGSASALTNPGSGDFSLNANNPGGAQCKGTGFPGAFPAGTSTSYNDIGAIQHQGGGGTRIY